MHRSGSKKNISDAVYQTVDETSRNLTEGGYGFVRGEVICGPTTSGHDYRIGGEIFAGKLSIWGSWYRESA